ncbi:NACHT domain-containing protein [Chroococcidiopsis sp. FACHB-1243]|uniref:NB-ARC domain-containing protein n=1 Tax=Chroococcidiopsis sp. [FACHB-1243] TaxID=2692781 RepID=UPI00178402A9|nr:NB-ARC domain-containing protein [Chroococcidiopsis sp. [FACHB-1243]]MBD2308504.1 NACHT domain-containing protein [Chroococcidiopsis sp. [FACHB-1243]]
MDVELGLKIVEQILDKKHLSKVQEILLQQSFVGHSYVEIAKISGYDAGYLKDAGSQLWQILSDALGEKVSKNNLVAVLKRNSCRYVRTEPDRQFNSQLNSTSYSIPDFSVRMHDCAPLPTPDYRNWKQEIDISFFYGRSTELSLLEQWILGANNSISRCRVVAIVGMGGIGKTALSAKLIAQIQDKFDCTIWRSLQSAPFLSELLSDIIQSLTQRHEPYLPEKLSDRISLLISYLRQHRCLLILDSWETILASNARLGCYREGFEGYGELIERLGTEIHQSCLILTSREKPKEIIAYSGEKLAVRSLQLTGLQVNEINAIYRTINTFWGTPEEWQQLVDYYSGNPLSLKIVASAIQALFDGNISQFLQCWRAEVFILDGIRDLLDSQFNRLSDLETEVMYWLAIEREPVKVIELQDDLLSIFSRQQLVNTLNSLCRRCLIDKNGGKFTQIPVIIDYITEKFTQQIYQEISLEDSETFGDRCSLKKQL